MIITCANCYSRVQINEAAASTPGMPSQRCPKCNLQLSSSENDAQKGALAVGGSPSTESKRFASLQPAPMYESPSATSNEHEAQSSAVELVKVLSEVLNLGRANGSDQKGDRSKGNPRRVLICSTEGRREEIAQRLDENGYQVFVAADTRQAMESMREQPLDVVVLDPDFDEADHGAAFVTREFNILRPPQRRRLFFCLLGPSQRTLDAHAAFLANANLIVNPNDLDELPLILDRAIRDYNDLYADFFRAMKVPAL